MAIRRLALRRERVLARGNFRQETGPIDAYLSSRVRSNHCTLLVIKASCCKTIKCLAKEQARSERMGFL